MTPFEPWPAATPHRAVAAFVGDELAAAGYRLAGVATIVPGPGEEDAALQQARAQADLVLVSADVVAQLPAGVWAQAVAAVRPSVVALPDMQGRVPRPALAARLRALLGMAA